VNDFFTATLNALLEELNVANDIAKPILDHMTVLDAALDKGSHKTFKSAQSSSSLYETKHHPLLDSEYHGLASAPSVVTTQSMKSAVELRETTALLTDSHSDVRTREGFKRMLTDLYRTATLLQNFQMLNHTGFVKLFKRLARPCFPTTLRPEVRFRTYSCCVDGV
jgi:SPX domain protein involved in polyphosphate accumulation